MESAINGVTPIKKVTLPHGATSGKLFGQPLRGCRPIGSVDGGTWAGLQTLYKIASYIRLALHHINKETRLLRFEDRKSFVDFYLGEGVTFLSGQSEVEPTGRIEICHISSIVLARSGRVL